MRIPNYWRLKMNSRKDTYKNVYIPTLIDTLKEELHRWDTKDLERLGDYIHFELQDRQLREYADAE